MGCGTLYTIRMSKEGVPTHNNTENPEAIFERAEATFDTALSPDGRVAFVVHEGGRNDKPNEDRVVVNAQENQYASIDGMGGRAHGGRAAQILAEEIVEGFRLQMDPDDVQHRAHERMQKESIGQGGACYVVFTLNNNTLDVYGAGDPQLMVLRKGKVVWRTIPEEGEKPGSVSNAVTGESAGMARKYDPFILEQSDRIIAGSDGFWEQFTEEEIESLVSGRSPDEAIRVLDKESMQRQNRAGGYEDNLNIIIKDYTGPSSGKIPDAPRQSRLRETPEEHAGRLEKTMDASDDYWRDIKEDTRVQEIIAGELIGTNDRSELLRALASGSVSRKHGEELLLRINTPQALFKEIGQYEGEIYSMPKIVAELAGHADENLTPEILEDMLRQYPDPRMLQDRAERILINNRKSEGYEQFIRVTLRCLYGKRHEYAEQLDILCAEAEKAYPELVGQTARLKREIELNANKARELGRQRASENIFGIMERRVEEILRGFERRYQTEKKPFDESILYNPAFVNTRYGDKIILEGMEKSAEITGIYGWGRSELINLDLRALERILDRKINREKIKKYPYGVD